MALNLQSVKEPVTFYTESNKQRPQRGQLKNRLVEIVRCHSQGLGLILALTEIH